MLIFLSAVFIVATACSLAGGAVVRRFAPAGGAVVPPRADRWHTAPTPTMGGIAIAAATIVGSAAIALRWDLAGPAVEWLPVPLGATCDVRRRHPRRPAAAVTGCQARRIARDWSVSGVRARGIRRRGGAAFRLHARRRDLVRRHLPCREPSGQHGRPCGGRRADRRRISCRDCWQTRSGSRSSCC